MGNTSSWQLRSFILCVTGVLFLPTLAVKGQIEPIDHSKVTILSEPAGAEVVLGDSLLGTTPMIVDTAIVTRLHIIYPGRRLEGSVVKKIGRPFVSSKTGVIVVRFSRGVMLQSVPTGSAIFIGDSLLGYTPQRIQVMVPMEVRVTYPGYESSLVSMTDSTNDTLLVVLDSRRTDSVSREIPRERSSRLPKILTAGALTAISTGVTVRLMQKSNELFKDFSTSGNAQARQDAQQYRLLAMLSLFALEVSFVCLTYFLFME